MADPLRDKLASPVVAIRDRLIVALGKRLLGYYGIDAETGERRDEAELELDAVGLDARRQLMHALDHFESTILSTGTPKLASRASAARKLVREASFTLLNRLVALKMLEDDSRRALPKCITGGRDATAFRTFRRAAPGWVAKDPKGEGRTLFLSLVYDELAGELGELFDTGDPRTLLDLPDDELAGILEMLDAPELSDVWSKDETLGWVYQLFTTAAERKKSRDLHKSGPPNSDHLAFRNQFYTPRYVVELLVDNTLGRLWCEMHPSSPQRERRELLCIRPGEKLPSRAARDASELKVLDPACGSGHFHLYAFDVLAELYEESGMPRTEIPASILKNNLFGIDIDRRAAQIAALGLVLRGKRYEPSGPPLPPPNIVVAQAIGTEDDLWRDLLAGVRDSFVRRVLEHARTALARADEIGALFPMKRLLAEPLDAPKTSAGQKQLGLFDHESITRGALAAVDAMRDKDVAPERRLFATEQRNDIGLMRSLLQSYDVVLMNPPFGAAVPATKELLKRWYPRAGDKTNLYAAFVEQGLDLLRDDGYLGAITDRSGFFITTFQEFREEVVLGMSDVTVFADLGFGVLGGADEPAKVEAAAYVLRRSAREVTQ